MLPVSAEEIHASVLQKTPLSKTPILQLLQRHREKGRPLLLLQHLAPVNVDQPVDVPKQERNASVQVFNII